MLDYFPFRIEMYIVVVHSCYRHGTPWVSDVTSGTGEALNTGVRERETSEMNHEIGVLYRLLIE